MSWSGSDLSGAMRAVLPGELAWYVTGRFYVGSDGAIRDAGYFLHLQGLTGDLFHGAPGEGTARFTFLSAPFRASHLTNGDLTLAVDTVGEFSLYLNRQPAATFDNPQSFATGEEIATFRRTSIVVGSTVGGGEGGTGLVSLNVFSARLTRSREFEFERRLYDLGRFLPHGVTQWGTASTQPISPSPVGFSTVVPFVGSAVAIGG